MRITKKELKLIILKSLLESKGDMAKANLPAGALPGIDLKREYNRLVGPKGQAALHKELLFIHWGKASNIDRLCEYHLNLGNNVNKSEISTGIQQKSAIALESGNPYESIGMVGVILDGFVTLASNSDLHTSQAKSSILGKGTSYGEHMKKTSGYAKRPLVGTVLSQAVDDDDSEDVAPVPPDIIDIFESQMLGKVGDLTQAEKDRIRSVLITHPSEYAPSKGMMSPEALVDNFKIAGICVFKSDAQFIGYENENIAKMSLQVPVIDEFKNINNEYYETALAYNFSGTGREEEILEQNMPYFQKLIQSKFK